MPVRLLHMMAGDLGVMRIAGEDDARFTARTAYTALRFWMQAYCLDDGYGGSYGLSGNTVRHRAVDWLRGIGAIQPGMASWYGGTDGYADAAARVFEVLKATGDLVRTADGLYRCTSRHSLPVGTGRAIVMGLADPTDDRTSAMSGMAYLTSAGARPAPVRAKRPAGREHAYTADFTPLDGHHTLITLSAPLDLFPKRRKVVDLLTWPHRHARDRQQLVVRTDYMPVTIALLENIGFTTTVH